MRFRNKKSPYKIGEKRIVTKFLFFPVTIKDETRWFEKVTLEEEYEYGQDITTGSSWEYWRPIRWID